MPGVRAPCPKCGATKRQHDVSLHIEGAGSRVGLEVKAKHAGYKKPHVELKTGPSLSRQLGKPVDHKRLIDRANDRYCEEVRDYENGAVLHHADEPLSKHTGHGSAKSKKT